MSLIVLPLPLRWRQRLQAWWNARHPPSDTHRMGQRNTYILPSTAGLAFGLTLVVLLLAAINEQLSLGYALSFLLAGAGLASMHATHTNLRGLSLALRTPPPAFAGEDVALDVALHNEGAARYGIGLRALSSAQTRELAWVDVPQRGHSQVQLRYTATQRGLQALPDLRIQTLYPLGLFRAWSLWRPRSQIWIYPCPEPDAPPAPPGDAESAHEAQPPFAHRPIGPDMEGVRSYQRGDAARLVLWKKSMLQLEQGQALLVRDTRSPQLGERWLAWSATAGLADDEARLSRLCAWVLAAEAAQRPYGLRLPGRELPPGLGTEQRQRCLEALASYAPGAAGAT